MVLTERLSIICVNNKGRERTVVSQLALKDGKYQEDSTYNDDQILASITEQLLCTWIDMMGLESAEAQNLKIPVTTFDKFRRGSSSAYSPIKHDDQIYLLVGVESSQPLSVQPLGFIRVGRRSLYLTLPDIDSELKKMDSVFSALDFYVRTQRQGHGHILFSQVLKFTDKKAYQLSYDRPSPAMLAFLNKHHFLGSPHLQHNHFAIFDKFNKI